MIPFGHIKVREPRKELRVVSYLLNLITLFFEFIYYPDNLTCYSGLIIIYYRLVHILILRGVLWRLKICARFLKYFFHEYKNNNCT